MGLLVFPPRPIRAVELRAAYALQQLTYAAEQQMHERLDEIADRVLRGAAIQPCEFQFDAERGLVVSRQASEGYLAGD